MMVLLKKRDSSGDFRGVSWFLTLLAPLAKAGTFSLFLFISDNYI